MCGICGTVSLTSGKPPADIQPMLDKLTHRGPQGAGVNRSGAAMFGTQRLAIRGLDDGMQPVMDRESGVIAVCNGEIDNHMDLRTLLARRNRSVAQATDVAVIPALYLEFGEDFVEKLDGVFAIALWDPRREKLILARDRSGERPLFYRVDGTDVSFATEVAALAAGQPEWPEIDREAVAGYLQRGCFAAPESPFINIRKVKPGCVVTISGEGVKERRYWRWPAGETPQRKPSATEFDDVFRAAVRRQSAVDVPFGLFMSGGVDSSLIAAVVRDLYPEIRPPCYTLRFAEESYDEGDYAARAAQMLGLETVSVPVTPDMFMAELPWLVRTVGEPLADPAWIPTALLARRAAQDVRIVLSGEGGDELFGGYPTYPGAKMAGYYARLPRFMRSRVAALAHALPDSERKMPLSFLLKKFVDGAGMSAFARHLLWTSNIPPALLARLGLEDAMSAPDNAPGGLLDRLQRFDLETTLAEGLLTKADRGGMSASLEIRAPFLDRQVMEFAATLPENARVRGLTTKYFLKRYARRYLPASIVHRKKRGLSVPLASWLRGPMREWAHERLAAGRLAETGLIPDQALALFSEHCERKADHARALWSLLVLDEWLAWSLEQEAAERARN